jgi:pyruvate/2-oxoglutarate/acetoin dehydrogenase E1 component
LLPFDTHGIIGESIKKTSRVLFADEDVPGGASAYMLQQVIEGQDIFKYLDSEPQTLTAKAHRPAYSTDGDYFSKPSADDVVEKIYEIMHEANPKKFPSI